MEKNKYLDFNGLKTYDALIKKYTDGRVDIKQDNISDLDEIRTGASLGATALQTIPSEYVTEDELENKNYTTTTQVENIISGSINIASNIDIDDIFK